MLAVDEHHLAGAGPLVLQRQDLADLIWCAGTISVGAEAGTVEAAFVQFPVRKPAKQHVVADSLAQLPVGGKTGF